MLFEAALQDHQTQTDMASANHLLAEKFQNCNTVEPLTAVLCEKTQAFSEFRRKDEVLEPLKNAVSVLYEHSAAADFGQAIGLVRP